MLHILSMYISFRITPFYALYVGFIAILLFHMGSGPLWHFVSQKKEACRLNWWKHFLYIDNYFTLSNPPTEAYWYYDIIMIYNHILTGFYYMQCMIQSWYLASDMQLFVFSPLFIYPLWKWSKAGLAWITFSILTIIGALAAIFTLWNLPATSIYLERPYYTWLFKHRSIFFTVLYYWILVKILGTHWLHTVTTFSKLGPAFLNIWSVCSSVGSSSNLEIDGSVWYHKFWVGFYHRQVLWSVSTEWFLSLTRIWYP